MDIEAGNFYKAHIKGKPCLSYFYVLEVSTDKVKFKVTEKPDKAQILTVGTFTMNRVDFEKMLK